jgi:CHAD domain-containing protein
MTSQVEAERKYALADGQELPPLDAAAVPGQVHEFDLVATYYDSPDCRLQRAKVVLRRREGGHDDGWHVKTPGDGDDERHELHAPLGPPRPPSQLREQVEEILDGAALVPLAVLRTHRREQELLGQDGAVLALTTTDEVESTAGADRQSWREAEVELVSGDAQLLDAVEQVLARAGIERSSSASKGGQAMQGRVAAAAAIEDRSAGAVLLQHASRQVGTLQAYEAAVRSDGPDAVHKSRVATRRLRSTLKTFAGVLDTDVTPLRAELRWHAELLGAARDAEVLAERMLAALEALPQPADPEVARLVSATLSDAHAAAHARLVESMDSPRYEELHAALERFLAEPEFNRVAVDPAKMVLTPMLGHAVRGVRKLARAAAARPGELGRWHEVRKAAKAARYGAEALVPALGERAEDWRARWEAVTEALGAVQDCVVGGQAVADLAARAAAEDLRLQAFDELRHEQDRELAAALLSGRRALRKALAKAPRDVG